VRIAGADLRLFEFDWDLTWYAFILNADEMIYGRYGGRDAKGPDERLSLKGLRYALDRALETHKKPPQPVARPGPPKRAEDFAAARRHKGCIHCHNVKEFERADLKAAGKWDRDLIWTYPPPDNLGITLDVDRGDLIKTIKADSPAAKLGIKPGDTLRTLNGVPVASFADASYGLHKAPAAGPIPVTWLHDGKEQSAKLDAEMGWRKTNATWRPSLLDILPSAPFSGEDLTAEEKQKVGLTPKRLAFRQDKFVHSTLREVGVVKGDIIVGLDGKPMDGTMEDFLGHVRRNYLVGDTVTIDLMREGMPFSVTLKLK
jgi:serine protease Do